VNELCDREAAKVREAEAREREAELERKRQEEERFAKEEEERRQAEREKGLERKKGVGRGSSARTVDSSSSGVRGVRGTRASMRARGVATGIVRGMITLSSSSQGNTDFYCEATSGGSGRGQTSNIPRHSSSTLTRTSSAPPRGRGRA
jgi:hypothetical protein